MLRFLLLFFSCITVSLSNTLCYGTSDNEIYNNDNGTCSLQSQSDYCFFAIHNYRTVTRGCSHKKEVEFGPLFCLNKWLHSVNINKSLYCCHGNYCNGCPDIGGLCIQLKSPLTVTNPPSECTSPLICAPSVSMTSTREISSSPIPSSSVMSGASVPTPNGLSQTCIIFISTIIILFILAI